MRKEELLIGLSISQIEKLRNCKSNEEILALAKEEKYELSEEQLAFVNGGGLCNPGVTCPYCGGTNTNYIDSHPKTYKCYNCDKKFISNN